MTKLIALYRHPADVAAFDDYYFSKHVPLAKTIAGLRRYEISRGGVGALQGEAPYHLAAILSFDSMAEMQAALASPEGRATAADLGNFAEAGVELLIFDTEEI
ncbi:MAG: EthD family reductase [Pseudomonadota bacterium]